jgi:hypothetical protein
MLDENSVLDPKDVNHNPIRGSAKSGEPPMEHHQAAIGHAHPGLVFQRRRQALDEVEQARGLSDVCTVLMYLGDR